MKTLMKPKLVLSREELTTLSFIVEAKNLAIDLTDDLLQLYVYLYSQLSPPSTSFRFIERYSLKVETVLPYSRDLYDAIVSLYEKGLVRTVNGLLSPNYASQTVSVFDQRVAGTLYRRYPRLTSADIEILLITKDYVALREEIVRIESDKASHLEQLRLRTLEREREAFEREQQRILEEKKRELERVLRSKIRRKPKKVDFGDYTRQAYLRSIESSEDTFETKTRTRPFLKRSSSYLVQPPEIPVDTETLSEEEVYLPNAGSSVIRTLVYATLFIAVIFATFVILKYAFVENKLTFYGKGELYHDNKKVYYSGDLLFFMPNGFGEYYDSEGRLQYRGYVKWGTFAGQGDSFYQDGSLQSRGTFEDGFLEEGTLYYQGDGEKVYYEGDLENGIPDGIGTVYDREGTVSQRGRFENGTYRD